MPAPVFAPGRYRGRILMAKLGKSKNKGTPYIGFHFAPIGMKVGDTMAQCPDYERTIFRYITEGTIEWLLGDLEKLGYDRHGFDEVDADHPTAFPFAGIEVDVACKHEAYTNPDNGETSQHEKWEFDWGGGMKHEPLSKTETAKLNAMFGKGLKKPAAKPEPVAAQASADVFTF